MPRRFRLMLALLLALVAGGLGLAGPAGAHKGDYDRQRSIAWNHSCYWGQCTYMGVSPQSDSYAHAREFMYRNNVSNCWRYVLVDHYLHIIRSQFACY